MTGASLVVCALTDGQVMKEIAVESGNTEPLAGTNVTLICKGRGTMLQWRHGHHNIT